MRYGFGIDVGGTTVKLAFFDETGFMLDKWEIPTNTENNGTQILPDIADSVKNYLNKNDIASESILGLGIGVPGPVNGKGVVNKCINLGWGVFNIAETLSSLTGFHVKAGNDANVAALGEYWKGGGAGCENMVFVTLGTGVGGGIVIGGNLLHGSHGSGAEIGHMVLNPSETIPCNCGKFGCVEQYCSATGIARLAREYLAVYADDSSLRTVANIAAKDVFDAAKSGDAAAKEILNKFYDYMGQFLGSLCSAVDPEVVVLGGGVSRAGEPLLDGVKRHFAKWGYHACQDTLFRLATLGNDAGAYGAFKLVAE